MIEHLEPDQIASVVSFLECRPIPETNSDGLVRTDVSLVRQTQMSCAAYRKMFQEVGQHWFWFSRLQIDDETLSDIIHDPSTDLHTLHDDKDEIIGFIELNCADLPRVHISFLGVIPGAIGHGFGTFLMQNAFRLAQGRGADHLRVQTCTLDHPSALGFYQKMGFQVYGREVEITDDPRLDGTLPLSAAPHIPLIGS